MILNQLIQIHPELLNLYMNAIIENDHKFILDLDHNQINNSKQLKEFKYLSLTIKSFEFFPITKTYIIELIK